MSNVFTGFSTQPSANAKNFKLYDIELIKQDLMNHFHTRIGERVMRPEYGCRIWDYLMEQFTDFIRTQIISEAVRICNEDDRVSVVSVNAKSQDNAIQVSITLNFHPFNIVDNFVVNFESRQSEQGF